MADTNFIEEEGSWQTVEKAAVSLGLSVRTVNRHIQGGKLRSRLIDGRREIFVAQPTEKRSSTVNTANLADEETKAGQTEETSSDPPATTDSKANFQTAPAANSFSHGGQTVSTFGTSVSFDVETALARADNAADKAELAVSAYQTLARSIEAQANSAKRTAKVAWVIVAVLTIGAGVAIGWTATKLTESRMQAEQLHRDVGVAKQMADGRSSEVEQLRDRLSVAEQKAANAEGRASTLSELQAKKPATRPNLVERLTSAFSGQTPSEH